MTNSNPIQLQVEKIPADSEAVENEIDIKVGDLVDPARASMLAATEDEPGDMEHDGAYSRVTGERVAKLITQIDLDDCLQQLAAYDMQRAKVEPEDDGYRVTRWHHPDGRKDDFFVPGPLGAAVAQMIYWAQERTGDSAVGPWDHDTTALILAVANR